VEKLLLPVALIVIIAELILSGPALTGGDETLLPPVIPVEEPDRVDGWVLAPVLVAEGLESPTDVVGAPDDDRLFIVEKAGRVRIMKDGAVLPDPYIDLSDWVRSTGNEQGMLGIRFHPDYAENLRVMLFYTDLSGTSKLVEVKTSTLDPNRVEPGSVRQILSIPQYGQYHQSGSMFFGPDGKLWVSLGDGGGLGDPEGHGQNPGNLDATIIRIDVDRGFPYSIPDDNPFVEDSGVEARPEVWAYGLRNPWRITYDVETGLIYIPDVGQEGFEELNVVPLTEGGHNFGWSMTEGTNCYQSPDCDPTGQTMPVYTYAHNGNGCAIIGGSVYRGDLMPQVRGHYFFADFCLGWIRSVVVDRDEIHLFKDWTGSRDERLGTVTTIGSDRHGELYVANLEGEIWRLELAPEESQ